MMLRKRAWDMMRDEFPTVQDDASLAEAIRVMRNAMTDAPDSQVVVVRNKGGKLVGAINLWNLFKAVKQAVLKDDNLKADGEVDWDQQFANACLLCTQLRLDDYLITNPPTLKPNEPILLVLDTFIKTRRDWALVVENDKVMGVVYVTDVYREMTRDMIQLFK
ncbi:MAG: CBS domain-containing protein [Pseudodesulfovibrio sp.]|uniref:CBS domain containing protein n=1 Tax=Pseudodesulfovibrio aespoeensis (strain ATCC 700646 / DSM 10631 / Aspo-2) TaxID=643562 RepID=E6VXE8_PSEA9|nr:MULTISPECIES: CBS domain-containing protein [Pseudodesulfovibrio]MBU4191153.1 CBS domain-containing protein [Pseudomonadota bacterium]ADU63764.1 CBS domain containing protein [Pseudodesulfovibrio aespoeensis Aspo-2]MBU4244896.1 CBS domain-containing protein [Pseudomonadota bacterium]MBU4379700.1 CBS domain-containing protein [Pseudomonadota bacterium]MBU4475680.1 CBS domain-containing protein [Pseudomonadota bacterium]